MVRFSRRCCRGKLRLFLGAIVLLVALATFVNVRLFLDDESPCRNPKSRSFLHDAAPAFDAKALSDRLEEALSALAELQERLENEVLKIDRSKILVDQKITGFEFRRYLDEEVIQPLYKAHIALRHVKIPKSNGSGLLQEDPLINSFSKEEIRKYLTSKENRGGNRSYNVIGHACVLLREDLEMYMDYEVGSYCSDDWPLGQKLMLGGCDPLPRRRCLARSSRGYRQPFPINESLWRTPEDDNVRWSNYNCRSFSCLSSNTTERGFSSYFDLEKEKLKWVSSRKGEFLIKDVLAVKPGEIRIGLDVGVGTGTFAARMRDWNVTIVSTALNLGAPFSEMIALRGLLPLYMTMSQRLPFFDGVLDLIHTGVFLDGWIDLQLLDFMIFDWDRALRPHGLLWIDRLLCRKEDMDDYMNMFLQLRYKKHRWVVSPKSKEEVYFSALLEKTPRSL